MRENRSQTIIFHIGSPGAWNLKEAVRLWVRPVSGGFHNPFLFLLLRDTFFQIPFLDNLFQIPFCSGKVLDKSAVISDNEHSSY
jgi:hypothetical protein